MKRKIKTLFTALLVPIVAQAQVMCVHQGESTTEIPIEQIDSITFKNKKEDMKIVVEMAGHKIPATLNNTRTANEFKKHLPFTATVSHSEYDFCGSVSELPTNDSERQNGWKNGDIGYAHGWIALFHSGEEESSGYRGEMIIGHMDDSYLPTLRSIRGTQKVTISAAE